MTLLFAMYSIASLPVSWRRPRAWNTWLGSGIALLTLIHLLGWNLWFAWRLAAWELTPANPLWLALLVHGLLIEVVALGCWVWHRPRTSRMHSFGRSASEGIAQPLTVSGVVSSAVAVAFVLESTRGRG
jgi:hypothetical protein